MKSENVVMLGNGEGVKAATCNAKWDKMRHLLFIHLCESEIKKRNKPGVRFSKDGWKNMVRAFNRLTKSNYQKKQLKNHLDRMKIDYKLWLELTESESGIGWDYTTNNFDADDEWWNRKLKENKNYAKLKGKDLRLIQEKYPLLFDENVSVGSQACVPVQDSLQSLYQRSATLFLVGRDEETGDSDESKEDANDDFYETQEDMRFLIGPKRKLEQGESSSKKNAKTSTSLHTPIDSVLHVISNKSSATSAYPGPGQATVDDCMKLLKEIPGVEPKTRFWNFACNLFLKAEAREVFVRQPDADARLSWVEYNYSLNATPCSFYPPPYPGYP